MNVTDLIERLREYGLVVGKPYTAQDCACHDAADALEAQAREIGELQAKLDARRNIDRYVSFALAGDEGVNPQDAADVVMSRLSAAERERDEAVALLRDVRDHGGTTWRNLTTRIDAFLAKLGDGK